MSRRRIMLQWVRIILGLLVFAFGVHLTIWAPSRAAAPGTYITGT